MGVRLLLLCTILSIMIACKQVNYPSAPTDIQKALATYIKLPQFTSKDFVFQALDSTAMFQHYDSEEEFFYFTIDSSKVTDQSYLSKLAIHQEAVQFGQYKDGHLRLGKYVCGRPNQIFFRIPLWNIKVDSSRTIKQYYHNSWYEITLNQLSSYVTNRNLYGGNILAKYGVSSQGVPQVLANHCAPIALGGEPSLQKLVYQIIDTTESPSVQAQKLLDFVTEEILYESHKGREILMRPNEVLLSTKSDCSGKVVLFASMLEQLGIDYLLVYLEGHIAVALSGEYPLRNRMYFHHNGTLYHIAETTTEGFQIGETKLEEPFYYEDILYLQKPGRNTRIFDMSLRDSLEYL